MLGMMYFQYRLLFSFRRTQIYPLSKWQVRFRNPDGAVLSFGTARMDFQTGIKQSGLWKSNMDVLAYKFIQICAKQGIEVARMGFVVQTIPDKTCIEEIDQYVSADEYKISNEKSISWTHKSQEDGIRLNTCISIQINENNDIFQNVVVIDVNTQKEFELPHDESGLKNTVTTILDKIEERLKNVF